MSLTFWIVAGLSAFLMGLSKGGVPMVSILSVPLMSIFMPPAAAAGLLLPLYLVADAYAIYLYRGSFSSRNLKILLPSAFVGVAVGFVSVAYISGDFVKLLLVGISVGYLLNSLKRRLAAVRLDVSRPPVSRGLFWGTLAGLTSYISHAGGPPYQAYVLPQRLPRPTYLGTTTIFFAAMNTMKMPAFIVAEQVTWVALQQAVFLIPLALLGAWSGMYFLRRLDDSIFYTVVEIALAVVLVKLLFDVFWR